MGPLLQEIQASDLGRATGDSTGLAIIHWDVKTHAESMTAPRLRICPFQNKPYERMVSAVLDGRASSENGPGLQVGDCLLLFDGGRPAHIKSIKKPWLGGAPGGRTVE